MDCEAEFKKCMRELCKNNYKSKKHECESYSHIYALGTSMLGCSAYEESQRASCECVPQVHDEL